MLELNNVSKNYGPHTALQPTDLIVPQGKTTVLIGQSGCGKSTILRLINGLIQPDSGTIKIDGQSPHAGNIIQWRRRMGYVIQEGGLFPHLTAEQNVTLLANYLGSSQSEIKQRVEQLVDLTHLDTDTLTRYPAELSGGQRQRVSLMRALMMDPDFLLLDEPLGALDPMIRAELQQDLRNIFQQLEKTVVLVTHDMAEAGYFGDAIVLLKDGRIVQQGTFDQLVNQPDDPFVREFINAQRSPLTLSGGDENNSGIDAGSRP